MTKPDGRDRRSFLERSVAALTATAAALTATAASTPARCACDGTPADKADSKAQPPVKPASMPCGMIGKAKISRLMLGGNLVSGCMHSRDLHYVGPLFRAYMTEQKIFETFRLAEQHGIAAVIFGGTAAGEDHCNRAAASLSLQDEFQKQLAAIGGAREHYWRKES